MSTRKRRITDGVILFVLSDLEVVKQLSHYFQENYSYEKGLYYFKVLSATQAQEALSIPPQDQYPVILVLDMTLPEMNGLQLAQALQKKWGESRTEIIYLINDESSATHRKMSNISTPYYLEKPVTPEELEEIVRLIKRRVFVSYLKNPVTHLPSGRLIEKKLERMLTQPDWGMVYIYLKGLEEIYQEHELEMRDEIEKFLADMIEDAVDEYGEESDFIGHIVRDQFLIITKSERSNILKQKLSTQLPETIQNQYSLALSEKLLKKHGAIEFRSDTTPFDNIRDLINKTMEIRG
jgi:DNA-binding response OmpR family regulator